MPYLVDYVKLLALLAGMLIFWDARIHIKYTIFGKVYT